MVDDDFKFRSGKHMGKTYGWVKENDPTYIDWVLKERPEMLNIKKKPTVVKIDDTLKPIRPNYNFCNEGPEQYNVIIKNKE